MDFDSNYTLQKFALLHARFAHAHAFGRILMLVQSAGCKTVVEGSPPHSSEATAESAVLQIYDKDEKKQRKPVRIHFFRGSVRKVEIQRHDHRYLGYCDLRSETCGTVSSALISARIFAPRRSKYLYLICQRDFEVPFANVVLKVRAFPYIQQDEKVVRCAESALASVAMYFGIDKFAPDFTRYSKADDSARRYPSAGLNAVAIRRGILALGRTPKLYDYRGKKKPPRDAPPEQMIYRYLESGIPVLVGFDTGQGSMHLIVVIGHTFNPDSWLSHAGTRIFHWPKSGKTHHSSTNWIERFIVQDDGMGPYTLAPADLLRRPRRYNKNTSPTVVFAPLHERLSLSAESAEAAANDLVSKLILPEIKAFYDEPGGAPLLPGDNRFWSDEFIYYAEKTDLVLRTSLRSAEDWKNETLRWAASQGKRTQEIVDSLKLSEKIWVIELSWPGIFLHARRLCGEIVLRTDAKPPKNESLLWKAWVWFHTPGIIAYRPVDANGTGRIECVTIRTHRDDIALQLKRTTK